MYAVKLECLNKIFYILHGTNNNSKKEAFNLFRLKKRYKKLHVLKNINLNIPKGEVLGIIGPNGSGKSTLLRIIANILLPTSGVVHINGTIANFIETNFVLNEHLTAKQNVFLLGVLLGIDRNKIKNNLGHIFKFAGLEKFINVPVRQFSRGMVARLGFSTTLLQNKRDIFLFDEPLAGTDIDFKERSHRQIANLIRNGKTLIIVSHNLDRIKRFCPQSILLNKGEILYYGKTKDTIDKYRTLIKNDSSI